MLGKIAYEAYCESTNWKSLVSGAQLPPYDHLKKEIQMAWSIAGNAVEDTVLGNLKIKDTN